ncbi:Chemotaxis protein CheY [Dyadobacter sp. CECT 9623]|jgi:CheY-like chemotaxis protein|uniref:Chemotaxis protein CheY n=1 Tax=Dyadobacter linearis TaxID=2823330 RepID=A0ABM8UYF3_9BACT|nr:response regulator [Dyadobacter sp. CECT 9623]CAG5074698.1 Chemotaxis protein CheY [Dyadobacter sp. CECT 9623]
MSDNIVLLADDDSDDRFFIQQAFKSCGVSAKVIEAENGAELINFLKKPDLNVSLIILDMNMPKMNGLEAMTQIKAMPHVAEIPVVMISTSPSQDLYEKAYKAGVQSFMPKPNTFDEFNDLVGLLKQRFLQ